MLKHPKHPPKSAVKSISEEDSGSVKYELSDYASTYTFCRSIDIQMVSLLYKYEFARVVSALTAANISNHKNRKYVSYFSINIKNFSQFYAQST